MNVPFTWYLWHISGIPHLTHICCCSPTSRISSIISTAPTVSLKFIRESSAHYRRHWEIEDVCALFSEPVTPISRNLPSGILPSLLKILCAFSRNLWHTSPYIINTTYLKSLPKYPKSPTSQPRHTSHAKDDASEQNYISKDINFMCHLFWFSFASLRVNCLSLVSKWQLVKYVLISSDVPSVGAWNESPEYAEGRDGPCRQNRSREVGQRYWRLFKKLMFFIS